MVKPFYKPLDRPENEEIWYCYYVPSKRKERKDSKPVQRIPISQVPDLTKKAPKESTELKEKKKFIRILETDSKYVKLAKAGGRKNLLCYRENERKNTTPKEYKVPEWYYHDDGTDKEVELSEEEKYKRYKVTYGKRSYKTLIKIESVRTSGLHDAFRAGRVTTLLRGVRPDSRSSYIRVR